MKYLLIIILTCSCAGGYPVTKESTKAKKNSQERISSVFGKNYNSPNKFKKKHF